MPINITSEDCKTNITLKSAIHRELNKYSFNYSVMLYDMLIIAFTKKKNKVNIITRNLSKEEQRCFIPFTLDDYMKIRQLKDRKSAREQFNNAINTLSNIKINFKIDMGKQPNIVISGTFGKIVRLDDKNSRIMGFILEPRIADVLLKSKKATFYYLPISVFTINMHTFQYAYAICHVLSEYYSIHYNDKNEQRHRISVTTLINAIPDFPKVDDIDNRHYKDRIIKVLINHLKELKRKGILKECYFYEHIGKKTDVTYSFKQVEKMSIDDFMKLNIWFVLNNHPLEK